jgi:NADPH-dependent curcumin reductase CurA
MAMMVRACAFADNVGGLITDAIMLHLINTFARIVICGQISQYEGHLDQPQVRASSGAMCLHSRSVAMNVLTYRRVCVVVIQLGPRFLHRLIYTRATIQGTLAGDYTHRMGEMLDQMVPWLAEGAAPNAYIIHYAQPTNNRFQSSTLTSDGGGGGCDRIMAPGKLKYKETVVEGFEKLPSALNSLFSGGNTGKLVVKL